MSDIIDFEYKYKHTKREKINNCDYYKIKNSIFQAFFIVRVRSFFNEYHFGVFL